MSKPRDRVELVDLPGRGPRVLMLPGLGARGTGFRALALALSERVRPVLVDYPEGVLAGVGAARLARQVAEVAGEVDAVVASSFGGMVAARLALEKPLSGIAFVGSFTALSQLGPRGRAIAAMGPIATFGRPGRVAASLAAARLVGAEEIAEIVPTSRLERESVWHRAFAIGREPPPPTLAHRPMACVAIHGARDVLVPVSTLLRLAGALPLGTRLHVLPDAGHVPYFTHPTECARLLFPWLDALADRGVDRRAG